MASSMALPHSCCAPIPVVAPDIVRPIWSVMIPTFNCAQYLPMTLKGVLAQDPGPDQMQIEVVDDGSTRDDPESVVQQIGKGRVNFFRQSRNVGHIENFATCLQRARGRYIHLLHGDDCVRTGFYQKIQAAFDSHPEIGAAFCRAIYMDGNGHWQGFTPLEQMESGILPNFLERLACEQRIMTPSMVVSRSVYESLGGFDRRLQCCEDWEMWVRIAARYPIWYECQPLALYRQHLDSNTGRHLPSGQERHYNRLAIELIKSHLPASQAEKCADMAREIYGLATLNAAKEMANAGNLPGAWIQVREALKFRCSPPIIMRAMAVIGRIVIKGVKSCVCTR